MTLGELLEEAVHRFGDREFLITAKSPVRYSEALAKVDGLAGFLADLGAGHGDRVAVLLPNCPEALYSWFALARLGAVTVPVNPALVPAEVEPLLCHLGVRGMIAPAATLATYAARLPLPVQVAVGGDPAGGAVAFTTPVGRSRCRGRVAAGDVATVLQTSGTTGRAKGASLTQASYSLPAREFVRWMEVTTDDRFLSCLPLFHMAGQAFVASAVAGGAALALVPRFSARRFWAQVRRYRATVARHLGEMLAVLCQRPPLPQDRLHTLRAVYGGGARPEVAEEFERRFGAVVVEGYGLTETNTVLRNELGARRRGSIGRPAPYCEVRIADATGRPLPPSTATEVFVGEIQVRRNAAMMLGYCGSPDLTEACFAGDWFRTGDLGYRDEEGWFYFVSREKDVIRRRGENIVAADVEAVLNRHPSVALAAVVGVPDEVGGEEVKAYLICRTGREVSPDELVAWCRSSLAEFKVPRYFELCDWLPPTATHKIDKGRLRSLLTTGGPCYDRRHGTWDAADALAVEETPRRAQA